MSETECICVLREWPTLQAKARTGKTKYWVVRAVSNPNGEGFVETEWWLEGGVHQTATRRATGKNIGKANETNPRTQALLEADSMFKKQKDDGYFEVGGVCELEYELPMLAHDFKKRGHNIKFPCLGQPKLDGFRCLYSPSRGFWSRQGKKFDDTVDLSHLKFGENRGIRDLIFDGELILPKPYTFQQTCQAIKKQREETVLLEYHIFDIIKETTYLRRFELLKILAPSFPEKVKLVRTEWIYTPEQTDVILQEFLEEGHEGLILRNSAEGVYEVGQRSVNLQKYKNFEDAEFEVVGITDGLGREEGAAILVCNTKDGQVFSARPRGTYEMRQEMFKNATQHIGTYWTIRYQNLSDEGIPRFPVGIAPREGWDQ